MKAVGTMDLVALLIGAVLAAVAPLIALSLCIDDPDATGHVASVDDDAITVQAGPDLKVFRIDESTQLQHQVVVGRTVQVWARDGIARKIAVKE